MKNIVILYHSDCPDGFSGAWAARKKFGKHAEYIPIKHQVPPPPGLIGKEIYLIDIVYPLPIFKKLLLANKKVVVIDHHKTARDVAAAAHERLYDLTHSGAVLAWMYFHPGKPVPHLLRYVEDMDINTWRLPMSHELMAYFEQFEFSFETWDQLAQNFERAAVRKRYAAEGAVIRAYKAKWVARIAARARPGMFAGERAAIVNSGVFESEVGNFLLTHGYRIALIWRELDGLIKVSLRSVKTVDVSKLAERYGGGGHPQAAGFKISGNDKLPWHYIKQ
jgi:oligoribonuclease NrnB/cAMP/cGMP phosphodiesterase (DHH superfamily)